MKRINWIALGLCLIAAALSSGCAVSPRANQDKVVVIAGASSGFGKGVALELADQGAKLVLAARRTEMLEELAGECERRGGKAIVVTTDVSDADGDARLSIRRCESEPAGEFLRQRARVY